MRRIPPEVGALPAAPGVYRFRGAGGEVLYVGRATHLRHRVRSYWSDAPDRPHIRGLAGRVERVEALACDSVHEAAWLERNLLDRHRPPWNRSGGEEVPVHIRLGAALRVVHGIGAADGYGPYLGGTRVRVAVRALSRIYPLPGANRGAALDLARARASAAADRDGADGAGRDGAGRDGADGDGAGRDAVAELSAVLRREPAAVARLRAELTRQRDAAAAGQAYERAARVQEEMAAVDWVVAEQKVTRAGGGDSEAHGWARGTLVRLEFRDGRLCGWRSERCERGAADLDGTAPQWRAFADRAAALAADLAGG